MTDERRRHERCTVLGESHVFFEGKLPMAGKLEDMGVGGFGFTYLSSTCQTEGSRVYKIICLDRNFDIERVTARTAWDHGLDEQGKETYLRRCGVQFQSLTEEQRSDICEFLEICTVT